MGVKVWEMPDGLEVEGHKVWVLPRELGDASHKVWALLCGLEAPGHTVWFCHTDWGVLWARKVRAPGRGGHLAMLLGLWGVGGLNSQPEVRTLRLRIYGYMAK